MVGASPERAVTEIPAPPRAVGENDQRLQVSHLRVSSATGPVDDVSFEVSSGECLGLVGLQGSGSATVADAIVGLVERDSGEIRLNGRPLPSGRVDISLRRGVGYVPEDRHARGFAPFIGVGENLTLTLLDRVSRFGLVSFSAIRRAAGEQVRELDIVTSGLDQPAGQLSGGNQQKVVVGRALARHPSVLVAIAPTVGVDVASKETLLNVIGKAREEGRAVHLVSDDLDDLRICTRLLAMVRGQVVREFRRPPWDRHELIAAVEGLEPAPAGGQSTGG
jgi:simple sugar transport system ATP-binding protein